MSQGLAAGPAFPLRPSPDGRYLVDSTGKPFFYHADTAWQLPKKATLAVAEEYFDRRAKAGFTAVQLHTVSKEVPPVSNLNGDEPFVPLEDILKPNEAYWRHWDSILEAAEKHGLFVSIAALWIRWGGQDKEGWRYQLTEDNARPYGQFLGQLKPVAGSPFANTSNREFTPPDANSAGDRDWVLVLDEAAERSPKPNLP